MGCGISTVPTSRRERSFGTEGSGLNGGVKDVQSNQDVVRQGKKLLGSEKIRISQTIEGD
jgi:hypothetical protein